VALRSSATPGTLIDCFLTDLFDYTEAANDGTSNPISWMQAINTHRLWAITLHSTLLNWPTSDLLRSESPNLVFVMENVVSTHRAGGNG
jgi:hypothetical protein